MYLYIELLSLKLDKFFIIPGSSVYYSSFWVQVALVFERHMTSPVASDSLGGLPKVFVNRAKFWNLSLAFRYNGWLRIER